MNLRRLCRQRSQKQSLLCALCPYQLSNKLRYAAGGILLGGIFCACGVWKQYFSDSCRYADIINGIGCSGIQLVKASDLSEADSQAGRKARDLLRRSAFGINFALIGIENQELRESSGINE